MWTFLSKEVGLLQFGSIFLILEPTASTMEHFMARESANRLKTLDWNIRPGLSRQRHSYRCRFKGWLKHVYLLKASIMDLEWIYPESKSRDSVSQILKISV